VGEWSAYFKALYTGGDATHPYHSDELNEHLANFAHAFMEGSEEAKLAAQVLNSPFTEQEVQSALDKMSDGKAAGIDGVPAEFLTHACLSEQGAPNVLATYLTRMFNLVMQGEYPSRWATNALCPFPNLKGTLNSWTTTEVLQLVMLWPSATPCCCCYAWMHGLRTMVHVRVVKLGFGKGVALQITFLRCYML
jgi:hypothetical protein